MFFLISNAYAQAASAHAGQENPTSSWIMLAVFMVAIYALVWWPQSRRIKQQRALMQRLAKEDEVVTNSGMLGRITEISDDFIRLWIAENTEIYIQKQAISAIVPKGTLKIK